MHLIKRAAFRAASAAAAPQMQIRALSFATNTPLTFRSKTAAAISQQFQIALRQYSDDAPASTNHGEASAVDRAVDSASAGGERSQYDNSPRSSYGGGDRDSRGDSYGNRGRGGYGGDRGRGGYGGGRGRGGYDGGRTTGDRGRGFFVERPPPTPTNKLYVGNLLFDITQQDIQKEFESFGKIKEVTIATDNRGLSKGFAYVEYETIEEAAAAIEAKHQSVVEGRRIVVNYMITRASTTTGELRNEPSKTIFIGNLAFEMSDADLNKLFRDIRNVVDVRVAIDRRTGQPRGFAHADFVDVDSAVKGMEALKDKEVYGRTLRLDYSAPPGGRQARPAPSEEATEE